MSITPPRIEALPASFVPNLRPMSSPVMQIKKVTAPIMNASTSASRRVYSAMVKPTDSASIEVATPCSASAQRLSPLTSSSFSPPRSPSRSMLPPM